jgi:hypothetical protein
MASLLLLEYYFTSMDSRFSHGARVIENQRMVTPLLVPRFTKSLSNLKPDFTENHEKQLKFDF